MFWRMATCTPFSSLDTSVFSKRIRDTESVASYDARNARFYEYLHTSWLEITHIYPFKLGQHNNILFVVKNSRDMLHLVSGNCLFPSFFAPKHRAAERAIERLNKLTSTRIPMDGPLSYGVGGSAGFEDGKLVNPLTIRVTSGSQKQRREIHVTHM